LSHLDAEWAPPIRKSTGRRCPPQGTSCGRAASALIRLVMMPLESPLLLVEPEPAVEGARLCVGDGRRRERTVIDELSMAMVEHRLVVLGE
jgi:hypothetical protein